MDGHNAVVGRAFHFATVSGRELQRSKTRGRLLAGCVHDVQIDYSNLQVFHDVWRQPRGGISDDADGH